MSEPMVTIPVRLAMRMARHVNSAADLFFEEGQPEFVSMKRMVNETVKAIAAQCDMDEVRVAGVALELEEKS